MGRTISTTMGREGMMMKPPMPVQAKMPMMDKPVKATGKPAVTGIQNARSRGGKALAKGQGGMYA